LTYVQGGQLLSIAERQNSEYALRLNKASRVINQTAVRIEAVRGALSLLLVVVAIVFAALGRTEPALAVAGFVWALVSTVVIVPWSKQASWCCCKLKRGAPVPRCWSVRVLHEPSAVQR
jgi:hypothetical protein